MALKALAFLFSVHTHHDLNHHHHHHYVNRHTNFVHCTHPRDLPIVIHYWHPYLFVLLSIFMGLPYFWSCLLIATVLYGWPTYWLVFSVTWPAQVHFFLIWARISSTRVCTRTHGSRFLSVNISPTIIHFIPHWADLRFLSECSENFRFFPINHNKNDQ